MDEFDLIDWIRAQNLPAGTAAMGDDAAVLPWGHKELVVATDMIVAGTHFAADTPPGLIGRKALAVNLSDMAAMACSPQGATVSLALPTAWSQEQAQELMGGMLHLAKEFATPIVGGDTVVWRGDLAVSVTIWGAPPAQGPVGRSGATAGDRIYVGGVLGASLKSQHHLTFTPQVTLAQQLVAAMPIHAMIDISDGLINDLQHITSQSGVGAELDRSSIPLRSGASLTQALHDGEDFVLCFCVPDSAEADQPLLKNCYQIGVIRNRPGIIFHDQPETILSPQGFVHGRS